MILDLYQENLSTASSNGLTHKMQSVQGSAVSPEVWSDAGWSWTGLACSRVLQWQAQVPPVIQVARKLYRLYDFLGYT